MSINDPNRRDDEPEIVEGEAAAPTARPDLTEFENGPVIGDADKFIATLKERVKTANLTDVMKLLRNMERSVQSPDRPVELYTDPTLDTFCCGRVPLQRVNEKGEKIDVPGKFTYLIGVPYLYAGGEAPPDFLRGEALHERGHADVTDFDRRTRFERLARNEGMDPKHLLQLDNLVEDPRMERLVGGPTHVPQRRQLFAKNRMLILPNIAKGIRSGKMHPAEQFGFLLKIERLWALHAHDLKDTPKPWSLDDVHPRAREEYERVAATMARISGDAINPPMKINAEVEKLIVDELWPAMKRLLNEFKDWEKENKNGKPGDGKGQEKGEGKGEGQGEPTEGDVPEEEPHADPRDPNGWPPELKKFFKKMVEQHQQRLDKEAEERKEQAKRNEESKGELDKQKHELNKRRDEFEDPKRREQYTTEKNAVVSNTQIMKRVFQRFLPKAVEPQYAYGRRGTRFSVKNLIHGLGVGKEKPLGKREIPEKPALILQIIIDVSGSMYSDARGRITNAVRACIATCEAAKDHNVKIEILASDEQNVGDDIKYLIKGFDEEYSGPVKSRLMQMMHDEGKGSGGLFGGDNRDAESIDVAVPRVVRKRQQMRVEADRIGALMIFITDSTSASQATQDSATAARTHVPLEGTAVTPEADIPEKVKYHFGPDSIIPRTLDEFPTAFQVILQRHMAHLRRRD
jgi:hypothetical protein